jgi:addiction module RelE/StbE family toxin
MKIVWTVSAVDDLESVHDYIARDSVIYAASFVERIIAAIETLMDLPEVGRKVPEMDNPDIRELIFQNYRIIYRIHSNTIQVLTIIRGSRDISQLPTKPWEII